MPQDLNYGYVKPIAGDESRADWFDIVADDIERLSEHTHDGNNSPLLISSSVSKYQLNLTSQQKVFTGLTYTNGQPVIDLGALGATAGMFASGADLPVNAYVLTLTGTSVTLSDAPTGSSVVGSITLSNWERTSQSIYERSITLPTGYPSSTSFFKFYVITVSDPYYNNEIFPTVVYDSANVVTVKFNDPSYDVKMVVL